VQCSSHDLYLVTEVRAKGRKLITEMRVRAQLSRSVQFLKPTEQYKEMPLCWGLPRVFFCFLKGVSLHIARKVKVEQGWTWRKRDARVQVTESGCCLPMCVLIVCCRTQQCAQFSRVCVVQPSAGRRECVCTVNFLWS